MYKELRHRGRLAGKIRSIAKYYADAPRPVTVIVASYGGFASVSLKVPTSTVSFVVTVGVPSHALSLSHLLFCSLAHNGDMHISPVLLTADLAPAHASTDTETLF